MVFLAPRNRGMVAWMGKPAAGEISIRSAYRRWRELRRHAGVFCAFLRLVCLGWKSSLPPIQWPQKGAKGRGVRADACVAPIGAVEIGYAAVASSKWIT